LTQIKRKSLCSISIKVNKEYTHVKLLDLFLPPMILVLTFLISPPAKCACHNGELQMLPHLSIVYLAHFILFACVHAVHNLHPTYLGCVLLLVAASVGINGPTAAGAE
jgi:hypothetical protein